MLVEDSGGWCARRSRPGPGQGYHSRTSAEDGVGMLYADDAGVASKSSDGLARVMAVIVEEVFRELGLTMSERETETVLMLVKEKQPTQHRPPQVLVIEVEGQN